MLDRERERVLEKRVGAGGAEGAGQVDGFRAQRIYECALKVAFSAFHAAQVDTSN